MVAKLTDVANPAGVSPHLPSHNNNVVVIYLKTIFKVNEAMARARLQAQQF